MKLVNRLKENAPPSKKLDWIVALLSIWFVGGIYTDGWAHNHLSSSPPLHLNPRQLLLKKLLNNFMHKIPIVALTGLPNSGKSTLINKLSGKHAAVTSDVAGTTRDRRYS
jgi:ribosome biogenesis GTPase A